MNTSTKLKSGFLAIFCCWAAMASAQLANVSYQAQVGYIESTDVYCGNDGNGSEQYTANVWASDNVNTAEVSISCIQGNSPGTTLQYGQGLVLYTRSNTQAVNLNSRIQAWEDDSGDRCTYQNNASYGDGDDCLYTYGSTAYNFRTYSGPSFGAVTGPRLGSNAHIWTMAVGWTYATGGTTITPSCTSQGSNYSAGQIRSWQAALTAGVAYRFSTCGTTEDTYIRIYRADGYTLAASADDNGPACSGAAASIDFIPPATDNYYIEVSQFFKKCRNSGRNADLSDLTFCFRFF
jgi:hypothetical protein